MGARLAAVLAAPDGFEPVGNSVRSHHLGSLVPERMEEAADEYEDPSEVVPVELPQLLDQLAVERHGR